VRGADNGMDREASVISWKKLRVALTSHVAVATVCDVATLSTRETTMYPHSSSNTPLWRAGCTKRILLRDVV
jgi:hypothetical protein